LHKITKISRKVLILWKWKRR